MNPSSLLIAAGAMTKNDTLDTTFYRPTGEANMYIWFGYGPLIICNHTCGQVSLTMNSDPINIIHTSENFKKRWTNKLNEIYIQQTKTPKNNTGWINNQKNN